MRRPWMAESLGLPDIVDQEWPFVCSKNLQQNSHVPPPFRPIPIMRQEYHANAAYLASRQTRAIAGLPGIHASAVRPADEVIEQDSR